MARPLLLTCHNIINEFLMEWITPKIVTNIHYKIEEKKKLENKFSLKKNLCVFCGAVSTINNHPNECQNCFSIEILKEKLRDKNFLTVKKITKNFPVENSILFENKGSAVVVEIKERICESNFLVQNWIKKYENLSLIEKKVPLLTFPRFITFLDNNKYNIKNKFVVLEHIEGEKTFFFF